MDQDLQNLADKVRDNINRAAILLNQPGNNKKTLGNIAKSLSVSAETLNSLSRTQYMRDSKKTTQK